MAMTPRLRLVPAADHKAQSRLKMKRIVLFGSQITTGGAQRVLLDQAQWFWDKGYDVQAVFFYDKDGLLSEWSASYPFPITALSVYRRGAGIGKNLGGLFHGFFGLLRMLKQVKPDYFESFTHDANLMGIPAAWLCGRAKGVSRVRPIRTSTTVGLSPQPETAAEGSVSSRHIVETLCRARFRIVETERQPRSDPAIN